MNSGPNIMISYRTPDREVANELHRALEDAGLNPWMDYLSIRPGSKWRDELLKELRVCDSFLAVLSRAYLQSEHCRMELFIARSRGCPVLPVMVEDCFDLLDSYEETKGLADTFMVRLYRLSLVGLSVTRDEAIARVVQSARNIAEPSAAKDVYFSYCNDQAPLATRVADQLNGAGIPTWVATRDCRVGENWRLAQARGVMKAKVQAIALDESILKANVLRTEILLAEAFGLEVLTILSVELSQQPQRLAELMQKLRAADITFRRLTDVQPFHPTEKGISALEGYLRERSRS